MGAIPWPEIVRGRCRSRISAPSMADGVIVLRATVCRGQICTILVSGLNLTRVLDYRFLLFFPPRDPQVKEIQAEDFRVSGMDTLRAAYAFPVPMSAMRMEGAEATGMDGCKR